MSNPVTSAEEGAKEGPWKLHGGLAAQGGAECLMAIVNKMEAGGAGLSSLPTLAANLRQTADCMRQTGTALATAESEVARLTAEVARVEAENARLHIAFLVLSESGHGGGMHEVRKWFGSGTAKPIPWLGGACFEEWAAQHGIVNCDGAMAFAALKESRDGA